MLLGKKCRVRAELTDPSATAVVELYSLGADREKKSHYLKMQERGLTVSVA